MSGFEGRVAIVTGAGAGLGRSHALGLARAGAHVVVSDIAEAAASSVASEIEAAGGMALTVAADVTDPDQVRRMAEAAKARWGRVDILVNNAGILRDKSFGKLELSDFELVMKVHVTGSFNCTHAIWQTMREQNYGRIVFTSSASGLYGNFGQANYGAAKAAMIGLMNVLHLEGAKYGIRVNTLVPTAATQMTAGLLPEDEAAALDPDSVTPAVLYLVGDKAPSRMIMGAGAGVFAVTHIAETEGIFVPEKERTPETIARRIAEITDPQGQRSLTDAFDQSSKFVRIAGAGPS
jgi:NAD(P)-dependent dehydrogenase (short-subunit alcohol dehydrogenase family)